MDWVKGTSYRYRIEEGEFIAVPFYSDGSPDEAGRCNVDIGSSDDPDALTALEAALRRIDTLGLALWRLAVVANGAGWLRKEGDALSEAIAAIPSDLKLT